MDSVIYNIPAALVDSFSGKGVIVRAQQPQEIVSAFGDRPLDQVAYVQVLGEAPDIEPLLNWGRCVPVDLAMPNPSDRFADLYRYSPLLANHSVRVSIAVTPGFGKAVKLATSLGFAVKLLVRQPDDTLVAELLEVLEVYLHGATVSEPVEFFHSLLGASYRHEPVTIWSIQEDDPAEYRYVTERGEEGLSERFAGLPLSGDPSVFIVGYTNELLADESACAACEFVDICCGYFKWPRREFRCDGVQSIFAAVREAARELEEDVASARRAQEGAL